MALAVASKIQARPFHNFRMLEPRFPSENRHSICVTRRHCNPRGAKVFHKNGPVS